MRRKILLGAAIVGVVVIAVGITSIVRLAIVRELVSAMGGSIAVDCALGVGSVFTVVLPA